MSMPGKPFVVRPNRRVRRGVGLILAKVVQDFDNGFARIFPEAQDEQILEITAAIEWMEQYADEAWEEA